MAEQTSENVPIFTDLSAQNIDDLEMTVVESLCMNCHESGVTRLLLTKIPFFKSVVISSFECKHCGHSDNEIQPAGSLQPKGCIYDLEVKTEEDLNRQVVKTDTATVRIPELDFEIPAKSQKGLLTTIEGILQRTVQGLEQDQPVRRALQPEVAEQIDAFIEKLKNIPRPFHVILDDPSGNSYVENPIAPKPDPSMKVSHYERTKEQTRMLGFMDEEPETEDVEKSAGDAPSDVQSDDPPPPEEVMAFSVSCGQCGVTTECRMTPIDIPFFKEVIIMATSCDACGARSNEVKTGGGIEPKGKRIKLKMTDPSDLNRDVLRSSTCSLEIPDLEFSHEPMTTSSGKFTTIEGLLIDVKTNLAAENPFIFGDSGGAGRNTHMRTFLEKLDKVIVGEQLVTIILQDPSGNSYLQNVYAPEDDPEMTVEDYERTQEENDVLGLTDMKTENYEEDQTNSQEAS